MNDFFFARLTVVESNEFFAFFAVRDDIQLWCIFGEMRFDFYDGERCWDKLIAFEDFLTAEWDEYESGVRYLRGATLKRFSIGGMPTSGEGSIRVLKSSSKSHSLGWWSSNDLVHKQTKKPESSRLHISINISIDDHPYKRINNTKTNPKCDTAYVSRKKIKS